MYIKKDSETLNLIAEVRDKLGGMADLYFDS